MNLEDMRESLAVLDWGTHGLTRHEIRDAWPRMPAGLYLRLPDSKRFTSADEVYHEASHSFARAEGEFTPADDATPPDGAVADGGPAAWGDSPLVSAGGEVGASGNEPVPGV